MNKMFIYWSPLAEKTYLNTLAQILEKWTIKEVENFEAKVESYIEKLKTQKNLCPPSDKHKHLRRCVVAPQTSFIYQINGNIIEIIAFIDNRSLHNF